MQTCDTCKWWTRETSIKEQLQEFRNSHIAQWEPARQFYLDHGYPMYGKCSMADGFVADSMIERPDQLAYFDCDGYQEFLTGEKFGCVHHEPKGIQG